MQISITRGSGCWGVPASWQLDTAAVPVGSQTRAQLDAIEHLAAAVSRGPRSSSGPMSTAPHYSVSISGPGATFDGTFDGVGLPAPVRALVEAVQAAVSAAGVQGGGFEL